MLAGGSGYYAGCYPVSAALSVFGPPSKTAATGVVDKRRGIDVSGSVSMSWEGGEPKGQELQTGAVASATFGFLGESLEETVITCEEVRSDPRDGRWRQRRVGSFGV